MNEMAFSGKAMTAKEVADVLGVTDEAIKKHIRELYPNLMRERVATVLNEEQITAIKRRMRLTTKVASAITDLEAAEMLLKSAEHFKARFEQERKLRIETESKLAIAEPKAEFFDQVTDSQDALQMRDVAAALNIPDMGRNKIFELLRKKNILDDRNVPYREYQDRGYFRVVEQKWTDKEGETHISLKTLVYQRGMDFIRRTLAHGGAA
ncbi:MAG: phage antirepressor KilAC domain-containing protein [Treponema sp.]|nr:phage antirepressor KilAC domain-containing protein [Treponema sp.]